MPRKPQALREEGTSASPSSCASASTSAAESGASPAWRDFAAALHAVFRYGTARTGALLAGQTPEQERAVVQELAKRLEAGVRDGLFLYVANDDEIRMPMPAVVTAGLKP